MVISKFLSVLGPRGTVLQYQELLRTYSRVLAKAISLKKKISVNLDRRSALEELISISNENL